MRYTFKRAISVFLSVTIVFDINPIVQAEMEKYLKPSLFSLVPPYIKFPPISKTNHATIPPEIKKYLLWPAESGLRKELHEKAIKAAGLTLISKVSPNFPVLGWLRRPRGIKGWNLLNYQKVKL